MSKRAQELAEAHWRNYIKPLLEAHGEDKRVLRIVEFHYLATAIHFYGHAVEDERNRLIAEAQERDILASMARGGNPTPSPGDITDAERERIVRCLDRNMSVEVER